MEIMSKAEASALAIGARDADAASANLKGICKGR
jgi:hypothetical protein